MALPYCTEYVRDEQHAEQLQLLLADLDSESDHVDAHFSSLGRLPMGKYFEQLLFYILDRDARFEVLVKNHQAMRGNETIGEIDLILKDVETGEIEHWEMALKYYLQSRPTTDHAAMLGPNAIDNLALKMKKLSEHQLPLSSHLTIRALLNGEAVENKLFLKGQCFYHYHSESVFPDAVNPSHEKATWCFLSEAESALDPSLRWKTIRKPDWIGSFLPNQQDLVSQQQLLSELKQHFAAQPHSLLCVGFNDLQETQRCFVVKEDWPVLTD